MGQAAATTVWKPEQADLWKPYLSKMVLQALFHSLFVVIECGLMQKRKRGTPNYCRKRHFCILSLTAVCFWFLNQRLEKQLSLKLYVHLIEINECFHNGGEYSYIILYWYSRFLLSYLYSSPTKSNKIQ